MYSKNPLPESELLFKLHQFSEENLWRTWSKEESALYRELEKLREQFRFPAVKNDVGQALNFLVTLKKPKTIFEMGSGYGHSAFWYLVGQKNIQSQIHLTERRTDLETSFNSLPWPSSWKEKMHYHQGDAFLALEKMTIVDLVLVDGEKGQYLEFLQKLEGKLSPDGVVVVDNAFVKGIFLQEENQSKEMVKKTLHLQQYLKEGPYHPVFLPVRDGIFLLTK